MNGATGWYFVGMVAAFSLSMVAMFWITCGVTLRDIRMWRNDRRDARDVKRGVL